MEGRFKTVNEVFVSDEAAPKFLDWFLVVTYAVCLPQRYSNDCAIYPALAVQHVSSTMNSAQSQLNDDAGERTHAQQTRVYGQEEVRTLRVWNHRVFRDFFTHRMDNSTYIQLEISD